VRDEPDPRVGAAGVVLAGAPVGLDDRALVRVGGLLDEPAERGLAVGAGVGDDRDLHDAADGAGLDRLGLERVDRGAAVLVAVELLDEDQRRVLALDTAAALGFDAAAGAAGEDPDVGLGEPERDDPAAGVFLRLPPEAEEPVAGAGLVDEPGRGVDRVARVLEEPADDEDARLGDAVGAVVQGEQAEQPGLALAGRPLPEVLDPLGVRAAGEVVLQRLDLPAPAAGTARWSPAPRPSERTARSARACPSHATTPARGPRRGGGA
jgi:hypothetical protein